MTSVFEGGDLTLFEMATEHRIVSAPPLNILGSRSTSNSSVPSVTTILTVAQSVSGVVPVVGTQLQAVFNLALLLARRLKVRRLPLNVWSCLLTSVQEVQATHASEIELLNKIEETSSVIRPALEDERSRHDSRFNEELQHIDR